MKRRTSNTTNILLGIIAAEVFILASQAIRQRREESAVGGRGAQASGVSSSSSAGSVRYLLGEAVRRGAGLMRHLFSSAKTDFQEGAARVRERVESLRDQEERESSNRQWNDGEEGRNQERQTGNGIRREFQDIAGKTEDPAWQGLLAAHDGDAVLASAERAVPMPGSAEFVERLDKNPFIGKGIRDHGRNERMSHNFPPQVLKIPGVTGDR